MMSPTLLKKYLAAARLVADHLVLQPEGFAFAPHPVVTDSERDQYCVTRILDFYRRHPVDYADYFAAAWRYRERHRLGRSDAGLGCFAAEAGLSARYLALVWSALTDAEPELGPLAAVRQRWRALPAWAPERTGGARAACERLRDLVLRLRQEFQPRVRSLHVNGISDGSQPFVLWRNRELARRHRSYSGPVIADLRLRSAVERFCAVFPEAFVVSDRGPYFDPMGPARDGRSQPASTSCRGISAMMSRCALRFSRLRPTSTGCAVARVGFHHADADAAVQGFHFLRAGRAASVHVRS